MKNIFENAYFGKAYKTRDGRKALFSRKDGDTFDLETEDSYNPVRSDGSFLYTKEGYESNSDIVSEWQEEINEEELDKLAREDAEKAYVLKDSNYNLWYLVTETFKRGYRKAKK